MASLGKVVQGLSQLPGRQQFGTILGLAVVVSLAIAAFMWGQTPDYRVLYSNLSDRDGGAIVGALSQMNVPYKMSDGGGAILVPSNSVHDVRLKLASQGLPKGSVVGFELMENQRIGVTQFQEQVTYQRALEGELAKTIQSVAAVQAARVHLAIPAPTVFLREQQKPSASVLVNLYPGRTLDRAQIAGIVNMISSSVPQLAARSVSVLDQNGNLLSAQTHAEDGSMLDATQLQYLQSIEGSYINRILAILEPIVGRDNVRAQVTADIDFSSTEQMAELYKPNGKTEDAAMRSQQQSESSTPSSSSSTAQGVPGAASNQPAANPPAGAAKSGSAPGQSGASAQTATNSAAAATAASNLRKETTTNFEVDKTIRHTRNPTGNIRRVSAAVVVNHKKSTNDAGEVSYKPLDEAEMGQIQALVRDAIGYNKERGDSLNVVNTAFTQIEKEALPEVPMWKQPETLSTAKDVGKNVLVGLLALYLLLGVVRPLLNKVSTYEPPPPPPPEAQMLPHAAGGDRLGEARLIAQQDPRVVANVVRGWVNKNG